MGASTNEDAKKFTVWQDGHPSTDLQKDSDSLGKFTYWVDGMPYVTVYPPEQKGGAFFNLVWGI